MVSFGTSDSDNYTTLPFANNKRLIRRVVHPATKSGGARGKRREPGRIIRPVQVMYGVIAPQNVKQALAIDADNGGDVWLQAIRKEVASLLALNCFEFHAPDYKPSSEYQFAKLSMIFEEKQDGRQKARLVAGRTHGGSDGNQSKVNSGERY